GRAQLDNPAGRNGGILFSLQGMDPGRLSRRRPEPARARTVDEAGLSRFPGTRLGRNLTRRRWTFHFFRPGSAGLPKFGRYPPVLLLMHSGGPRVRAARGNRKVPMARGKWLDRG